MNFGSHSCTRPSRAETVARVCVYSRLASAAHHRPRSMNNDLIIPLYSKIKPEFRATYCMHESSPVDAITQILKSFDQNYTWCVHATPTRRIVFQFTDVPRAEWLEFHADCKMIAKLVRDRMPGWSINADMHQIFCHPNPIPW